MMRALQLGRDVGPGPWWVHVDRKDPVLAFAKVGTQHGQHQIEFVAALARFQVGARNDGQVDCGALQRFNQFVAPVVAGVQLLLIAPDDYFVADQLLQAQMQRLLERADSAIRPLVDGAAIADEQVVLELRKVGQATPCRSCCCQRTSLSYWRSGSIPNRNEIRRCGAGLSVQER
jgi:hypothetical protein